MPTDWLPRTDLGLRSLVIVGCGAVLGLLVLHAPAATGIGMLSGLLLILADFHGDRRRRLRAYLVTAVLAAALVAGMSALHAAGAVALALTTAALAALFTMLKNGGGQYASAANALLAEVLLGVASGLSGLAAIDAFFAALAGGICATGCAMLIRPAPWISPVRHATLTALHRCSEALRGDSTVSTRDVGPELLRVYVERPERPATPTPTASASLDLLSDVAFLADLLDQFGAPSTERARTMGIALDASANALRASGDSTVSQTLTEAARDLRSTGVSDDFAERCMLWATLGIAGSVQTIARPQASDWRAAARQAAEQLRVRLSPQSTLLWSALTSALVFGVLVSVVVFLRLPHPQWVFLCAVSAFYPYTRRAAARAGAIVTGTLAGFLLLWLLVHVLGPDGYGWWLVLLVATWIAMSAPHTTGGTIYGQTSFTVLSLSLLGLGTGTVQAATGLERLVDIALGVTVALICVAALAPKNLRMRLSRSLATLFDDVGASVRGEDLASPKMRADFLRCTDVVDAMRGVGALDTALLVAWLNTARLGVQGFSVVAVTGCRPSWQPLAADYARQAHALRANESVPVSQWSGDGDPATTWLLGLLDRQAEQVHLLSPLRPARQLRAVTNGPHTGT